MEGKHFIQKNWKLRKERKVKWFWQIQSYDPKEIS